MLIDDVNGTRLNVIEEGAGQPVLFLHGLGGSWREWQPQIDGLSDDYRCIAVEHRGHGRSERTHGRYSIDLFADDAAALCSVLEVSRAHVVGLSMGGMIAQSLALRYPQLVASLVLIDTAARPEEPYREGLEAIAQFVRDQGYADTQQPGGTAAGVAWSPTTVLQRPEVVKDNLRESLSTDPDVYARACVAVANFDVADRLGEITAPTLVLWGNHDVLVPRSYSEVLRTGIARSELVIVPDAGHLCTLEQPALVNKVLRDFFERASLRESVVGWIKPW
ncbi:MAG TPA: alpha/beta fold hydrolase [Acidimicrobiales bacterium]